MSDITSIEIQEITRYAKKSVSFTIFKFPYLDSYKALNQAIIERAKAGENSISFDFIDNSQDGIEKLSIGEIRKNHNRIYLKNEGGQAINDVYDYPNYLNARGFKVEIRESVGVHGYITKSYYISW